MERTDEWMRVLDGAELDAESERFRDLVRRALSRFPGRLPPLKSVIKVQLRKRSEAKGIVGLTTYCCVEMGAERTLGKKQGKGSQRITFYRELLDQLSNDAALGVIAHELAHAWLNEHRRPEASKKREREADELARGWGYGRFLDALEAETVEE